MRGFVEAICATVDATMEGEASNRRKTKSAPRNELFVRTPYGTITMARPEPVWGGWVGRRRWSVVWPSRWAL